MAYLKFVHLPSYARSAKGVHGDAIGCPVTRGELLEREPEPTRGREA